MKIIFQKFIVVMLFSIIAQDSKGQIAVGNLDLIPKDKNNVTYVTMKDPDADAAQPFIKAIQDVWTIGKVEFITYSDVNKYNTTESYFLSIGGIVYTTSMRKSSGYSSNTDFSTTHVYLEYFRQGASTESVDKKGKKKTIAGEKKQIARIELYTDFKTLVEPQNIFENDYDASGHIRNWGPGVLKNYLQAFLGFVKRNEERTLYANSENPKELKSLRNSVLYVTEDVLIKFGKFNGDESKRFDEEDIFKNYSLKYKLVSMNELNEKILTETTPFYYLLYIKSSTDKYATVINSVSGEIAYTRYNPISYNFKSNDIEDLQNAIRKN